MLRIQNYINGVFLDPINQNYIDNIEPATGNVYGSIPNSDNADIALAVKAATSASKSWSKSSLEFRHHLLSTIAGKIRERQEELAAVESKDNGKPLSLAKKMDIPRAAANFEFFATAILQYHSESYFAPPASYSQILRQPIGVVGCISPWNLPLYLFTWKIAPAIAAGNCVIAKPSEITPASAFVLAEICHEAGLPPGVLNIVHGRGQTAGQAIISHPEIKGISFTGGTVTGKKIIEVAGPMLKKLSLELGGKNAAIILNDCDYETMLNQTVRSSFTNQGQICLCTSRILIQKGIYDRFKEDFTKLVKALKIGDPSLSPTDQGALVSAAHLGKIENAVKTAVSEGGNLLTGGKRHFEKEPLNQGYFFEPTIIEGLGPASQTNQEEIFGPVVTLQSFETLEEAILLSNATNYGLATVIWSTNTNHIHYLSENVQSGIVWVNCWLERDLRTPFGGVKNSGIGREGGFEALNFFTETKSVTQVIKKSP